MFKIRAIALREYLAAVRAKAFIISVLLMPVLFGISVGFQILSTELDQEKEKTYAVIDRTPKQELVPYLQSHYAKIMEHLEALAGKAGKAIGKTTFTAIEPSEATPEAMANQRFEISRKIEKGEYEGLIEIGPKVIENRPEDLLFPDRKVPDEYAIRFQAKAASAARVKEITHALLNAGVRRARMHQRKLNDLDIIAIQQEVPIKTKSLTRRDPKTGEVSDASDSTRIVNIILPGALVALMLFIVMMGAAPAMHNVIEEKSQRIAEVLLGSVTPFQLMSGKLLGISGVSLTLSAVYLLGGYVLARYYGVADLFPLEILAYFIPMLLLELFIFGSLFIAVGAAANNIKDTQALLTPVMMIACLPMFALGPIMQDPNGPIARICSFFPFATPMLMVARHSVPPGVPWWEMLLGTVLVIATTILCVWAAGRIFRVGILLQGKTPRFTDLIRWAVKG